MVSSVIQQRRDAEVQRLSLHVSFSHEGPGVAGRNPLYLCGAGCGRYCERSSQVCKGGIMPRWNDSMLDWKKKSYGERKLMLWRVEKGVLAVEPPAEVRKLVRT